MSIDKTVTVDSLIDIWRKHTLRKCLTVDEQAQQELNKATTQLKKIIGDKKEITPCEAAMAFISFNAQTSREYYPIKEPLQKGAEETIKEIMSPA